LWGSNVVTSVHTADGVGQLLVPAITVAGSTGAAAAPSAPRAAPGVTAMTSSATMVMMGGQAARDSPSSTAAR
jgi:hypothetical protein